MFLTLSLPALADAPVADDTIIGGKDGIVAIAPDKPEIVRLDEDAASVVVGSPKYASVTMDNPRTLLIIPRAEGSTSLTVLNKAGEIVMEKRIIVGGPKAHYVRIRRACTAQMAGCRASQTYYCPKGGCSDITLGEDAQQQPAPTGAQTVVPLDGPPPLPAEANIPPVDASALEVPQ